MRAQRVHRKILRQQFGKGIGLAEKFPLSNSLRLTYDEVIKDLRPIAAYSAKEPITQVYKLVMYLEKATLVWWLFLSANLEVFTHAVLPMARTWGPCALKAGCKLWRC